MAILCAVSGCGGPTAKDQSVGKVGSADQHGLAPPRVTEVQLTSVGISIAGDAAPVASIRLASPDGRAIAALADQAGHWKVSVPVIAPAAIYGLSQKVEDRTLQAEGYLLVTPGGRGVLMRSGAGALVFDSASKAGLTALDSDREGAAVVSGRGAAGTSVSAYVDGRKVGQGRIDSTGRFELPLTGPVAAGSHVVKVFGDGLNASLAVTLHAAAPLQHGPFRVTAAPGGLQIEWMTPGGGTQTTFLVTETLPTVNP